jgi:predicted PurR-regulated permease PerM
MDNEHRSVRVTVSNRTVVRVLALILVTYIAIKFIIKVDHILELIFLSLFLSVALNPAVSWLARNLKLKSRAFATSIAYLLVVVVLAGFFSLVVPPLVRQTETFVSTVPNKISSLKQPNSAAGKFIKHYKLSKEVDNLSQDISNHTADIAAPVWSTASKIGGIIASIIIVFVLTFMMIVEGPIWIERYWKLRVKKHDWHTELSSKMYRIITGYVNGQLVLALLAGFITLVSLVAVTNILHVSVNDVALAAIMILASLVPMIGHIIGGVIVVIACLFVSWPLALIMAIILLIYIEIASVTIQPYIQSKYNDLSPLLVLIAALLGIYAGGILGAFVAIPLAGCAKVVAKEYLLHKKIIN